MGCKMFLIVSKNNKGINRQDGRGASLPWIRLESQYKRMLFRGALLFAGLALQSVAAGVPLSWDWRHVNGSNWLNPAHNGAVRNQRHVPPKSWGGYYT